MKKILTIVLTLIVSFSLLKVNTFADSSTGTNQFAWDYGYFTSVFEKTANIGYVDIPIGDGFTVPTAQLQAYQTFQFSMNNYMNGSVVLTLRPLSQLNLYDLYVTNATIASWNPYSGVLNLYIRGTDNFAVTFVAKQGFGIIWTDRMTVDIGGDLTTVNSPAYSLHSIDSKLSTTNNTLSNLLNIIDDPNSNQSIEGLLNDISEYTSVLNNIETDLSDQNNGLPAILSQLSTAANTLSSINNYVNHVGQSLDLPTYSKPFVNVLNTYTSGGNTNTSTWNSDIQGTYTSVNGNTQTFTSYLLTGFRYIMLYAVNRDSGTLRPIFTSGNVTSTVSRTFRTNDLSFYMIEITTTTAGRYSFTFNATTPFNIYPFYFGTDWSMPSELMFITRNGFNDMYISKLDQIHNDLTNLNIDLSGTSLSVSFDPQIAIDIDAIAEYQNNINNLTQDIYDKVDLIGWNLYLMHTGTINSTDINNKINKYNVDFNTAVNIENNLSLQFNNSLQGFTPTQVQHDISLTTQLQNTSTFMNDIASQLFSIDLIKYPVVLTLLGIVIIAILG